MSSATSQLEYDGLGNVTKRTVNGQVIEESEYNEVGWLVRRCTTNESTTYWYDAEGNVVRTEVVPVPG